MVVVLVAAAVAQTTSGAAVEFPDLPPRSLRTRSMAGANVGVAAGASTVPDNPAALVVRRSFGSEARLELDASIQLAAHPWINEGLELLQGAPRQLPHPRARWRLGLAGRASRLGTGLAVEESSVEAVGGRWVSRRYQAGLGWAGDRFAVAVMPELLQFRRAMDELEGSFGGGATVGALWAPRARSFRVGGRVRTPLQSAPLSDGSQLRVPFEAALGVGVVLGAYNVRGQYGPQWAQRVSQADRWLVDVDLVVTGAGNGAVALTPLLEDGVASEVGPPTAQVRAGVEWATWRDRLRLRAGLASVPPRGATGGVRGSVGVGVEVFEFAGLSYRLAGFVGAGPEGWTVGVGGETW